MSMSFRTGMPDFVLWSESTDETAEQHGLATRHCDRGMDRAAAEMGCVKVGCG